jgi:hypothetical protein
MYCTSCRTAFSWRTGQIETGVVHNPHYWEYIRQHGNEDEEVRRQFGDRNNNNNVEELDECNFRFDNLIFNRDFMSRVSYFRNEIAELLREISHCQRVEIPRVRIDVNDPKNNEDIRLKYLENEIDEKKFKMTIQRRQKLNEYKHELTQILETFVTIFREITIKYYRTIMTSRDINIFSNCSNVIQQWMIEIKKVKDFTVDSIEKLCSRFNYTFTVSLKDHFIAYDKQINNAWKTINRLENKRKEEEKHPSFLSKGFVTYSEEMRELLKHDFANKAGSEIARELFNMWKKIPPDVKNYYRNLEEFNNKKPNIEQKKDN